MANPLDYLKNVGQDVLTLGSIPANLAAGITGLPIGYTTEPMRTRLDELARSKGTENFTVGYPDYGMEEGPLRDPYTGVVDPTIYQGLIPESGIPPSITDLALGWTVGDVSGKIDEFGNINYDPATTAYDFMQTDPTEQTETENFFLDLMNRGGIFGNRWNVPVGPRRNIIKDRRATQQGIAKIAMQKKIQAAAQQESLQAQVTAQANREARERVGRGEARDYGHTQTRSSSGWRSDPMRKGGIVNLLYGGFI